MNQYEKDIMNGTPDSQAFPGYKDKESVRSLKICQQTIDIMDRTIADNINNVVEKSDELWILGDFCWAKVFNQVEKYRDKINCQNIHLVRGNHDYFSNREYLTIFQSVRDYEELEINKTHIVMCHYPLLRWNRSHYGAFMLFGHQHGNMNSWIKEHMSEAKMLDVGVDSHDYKPWSFEDIKTFMTSKKGEGVIAEGSKAEERREKCV